jgi:transcriptional regulator with XRE-family HTH domain
MQALSHNFEFSPYNAAMPGGRPTSKQPSPLGSRIAHARQEAGLSQNELAEKLNISRNLIAQWERSAVALKAEQLSTLADILSVSVDALVGREEAPKRGKGPIGKARQVFERVSQLPRATQQRILANVEDAITAYEVRKTS